MHLVGKKVKKRLDLYGILVLYLVEMRKVKIMKTKKQNKHTPVGDVGFGTKKKALDEMGADNQTFDVLNKGFGGDVGIGDPIDFTDDLYEGIDELEDF